MSFFVGISIYGAAILLLSAVMAFRYLTYRKDPAWFRQIRLVVGAFGVVAAWITLDVPLAARIAVTFSGLSFMVFASTITERVKKGSQE